MQNKTTTTTITVTVAALALPCHTGKFIRYWFGFCWMPISITLETHRQSIMWQQTWLFDYCTRWHAAQHAIPFGCHFLSHLQIITINFVLSPLPVCRWITSIERKLLLEIKKLLMSFSYTTFYNISKIETQIWIKGNRDEVTFTMVERKTGKSTKMFLLRNKKSKNIVYVCIYYNYYCPERFHKALWIRR